MKVFVALMSLVIGLYLSDVAAQVRNPGECSWTDRGMAPSDPEALCHDVMDVFVSLNHVQDSRYTPADLYLLQSFRSRSAPYLERILRSDYHFTVDVKPGGTCLTVASR